MKKSTKYLLGAIACVLISVVLFWLGIIYSNIWFLGGSMVMGYAGGCTFSLFDRYRKPIVELNSEADKALVEQFIHEMQYCARPVFLTPSHSEDVKEMLDRIVTEFETKPTTILDVTFPSDEFRDAVNKTLPSHFKDACDEAAAELGLKGSKVPIEIRPTEVHCIAHGNGTATNGVHNIQVADL